VRDGIVNAATTGKVTGAGSGSPNRLLYTVFSAEPPPPPPPPPADVVAHVEDLSGSTVRVFGIYWRATVTIAVRNATGGAVSGATVTGQWVSGTSGATSCTTNASGSCSVTSGYLSRKSVASVTWSVNGISGSGITYDQAANKESSIVINRP
jgi:hypothetical protein